MDIKVKGTTRVGILAYDLNDSTEADNMRKSQKLGNISSALWDFSQKVRTIRKYDSVPEVSTVDLDEELKQSIMNAEEYYSRLLFECMEDNDALEFLD